MSAYRIPPIEQCTYDEQDIESQYFPVDENDGSVVYEPVQGELVRVKRWVRFPSFDFIFGVPDDTSPRYEKECAFFQFRDSRNGKKVGMYLDRDELMEFGTGINALLQAASERYGKDD